MKTTAIRALADAADALARLARAVAEDPGDADAMLSLADAARLAATSQRVLRDAIRAGELAAYGRKRDRAVRRGDLDAWIESRRVAPVPGVDDADLVRRVRRLAREYDDTRTIGQSRGCRREVPE